MLNDPIYALSWPCPKLNVYDVEILKSVAIDVIQDHHKYYILTGRTLYGGQRHLVRNHAQCHLQRLRVRGVLVALDYPSTSDPLLLSCAGKSSESGEDPDAYRLETPRDIVQAAFTPQRCPAILYTRELSTLIEILYDSVLNIARGSSGRRERALRLNNGARIWETPGPFLPSVSSMVDTWFLPLWRLVGDEYFLQNGRDRSVRPKDVPQGRLTYENVMAIIEKDVGSSALVLKAARRVPLPPPEADELSMKPAFESLIHIGSVADFKCAIVNIAKGLNQFGAAGQYFHALSPDQMLFQETSLPNTGVRGFILDLDPVECPMSMAAVPDWCRDQGSVRLAAYDLIASPTPPTHQTVYPRYALESLFHILVWFYASTEFAKGGGLVPRAPPYSWYNEWFRPGIQMHLPIDRTEHQYKEFLEGRRGFLADREHRTFEGSESRMAGMRKLHDDWVMPLWTLVREAQFFARWRDGECDFDWETLGGRFTVDNFMEILAPARSGAA